MGDCQQTLEGPSERLQGHHHDEHQHNHSHDDHRQVWRETPDLQQGERRPCAQGSRSRGRGWETARRCWSRGAREAASWGRTYCYYPKLRQCYYSNMLKCCGWNHKYPKWLKLSLSRFTQEALSRSRWTITASERLRREILERCSISTFGLYEHVTCYIWHWHSGWKYLAKLKIKVRVESLEDDSLDSRLTVLPPSEISRCSSHGCKVTKFISTTHVILMISMIIIIIVLLITSHTFFLIHIFQA